MAFLRLSGDRVVANLLSAQPGAKTRAQDGRRRDGTSGLGRVGGGGGKWWLRGGGVIVGVVHVGYSCHGIWHDKRGSRSLRGPYPIAGGIVTRAVCPWWF